MLRFLITRILLAIGLLLSVSACGGMPDQGQDLRSAVADPPAETTSTISLYKELRKDFKLDHYANRSAVRKQINWIRRHQSFVSNRLNNASPYLYYIVQQIHARGLPGELALLPIIESAYNPFAYSRQGAAGLWQLMPGTATGYGLKQDWWYDGRRDVFASTKAALTYLTYLNSFFNGNWNLAIAAYDSGEGTVQQAIRYNARHGYSTAVWDLPLPKETKAYVPRLLALAAIISHPNRYGIRLPAIKDGPYFAVVKVKFQIDLAHAAKLAGISLKQLYALNPGFNRWATDPSGPNRLLLPVANVDQFKQNLAKLPKDQRVNWHRYQVANGDSLSRISHRFHTTVKAIQVVNHIHDNRIYVGQTLLIPEHGKDLQHYDFHSEINYAKNKQINIGPRRVNYEVRVGDSLWNIATKYHVKISQIEFWNKLTRQTPLEVGQKLTLWIPQHSRVPENIAGNEQSPYRHYTVKKGDSLSMIANRFNVTSNSIKQLNNLDSAAIKINQKLKIPV